MAYQLKYEASYAGKRMTAERSGAQVLDSIADRGTAYSVPAGSYYVLTGYYYQDGWNLAFLTTNGMYIPISTYDGTQADWSLSANAEQIRTYTQSQADRLIQKIVSNNWAILQNNLVCARYAGKFTAAQQEQIRQLQRRVQSRNEALLNSGLLEKIETAAPGGYAELSPYLARLMAGQVGVATWVVVVVAFAVIAGLSTACYYTYKYFADESEQDIQYSKELTAILAQKLTEEEYQQLLDETKGIVTKAKIRSAFSSYGRAATIAAWIIGGLAVVRIAKNLISRQ